MRCLISHIPTSATTLSAKTITHAQNTVAVIHMDRPQCCTASWFTLGFVKCIYTHKSHVTSLHYLDKITWMEAFSNNKHGAITHGDSTGPLCTGNTLDVFWKTGPCQHCVVWSKSVKSALCHLGPAVCKVWRRLLISAMNVWLKRSLNSEVVALLQQDTK